MSILPGIKYLTSECEPHEWLGKTMNKSSGKNQDLALIDVAVKLYLHLSVLVV